MNLSIDPSGFWMSEKFDGWFLRWDGGRFTTANGNPGNAPDWFTAGLPARELHGELWAGHGGFDSIAGIVRSGRGWERLRFAIFDEPGASFPPAPRIHFETPFAFVISQTVCAGREHLSGFYSGVLAAGGEGVMLRMGGTVHKLKPCADEEAIVTGYGASKREFGVGSLAVRNHRGEFGVGGLSAATRCRPPRVGALVTFSFSGVTANGIPKAAMFKGERPAATVKAVSAAG